MSTNEHEGQGDTSGEERGCESENTELSLFQYGSKHIQLVESPNGLGGNIYGAGAGAGDGVVEYHLAVPTSNLAMPPHPHPQHRFESSSTIQLHLLQPYTLHQLHSPPPPHMNQAGPPWPNSLPHHQPNPLGRTQEIQFQGLVGPAGAAAAGPSSYHIPNTQQRQQGLGGGGYHVGNIDPTQSQIMQDLSSRNERMRMTTLQDNRLPQYGGQLQQLHAENPNYPPSRTMTMTLSNSVYDTMYEQMGLPVDPHLRMFLAKRNQGKD